MSNTAPTCSSYPRASQNICAGGVLNSCQTRISFRHLSKMWRHHCNARCTSTSNCPLRRRFWSKTGLQCGAGKITHACLKRRDIPQHGAATSVRGLNSPRLTFQRACLLNNSSFIIYIHLRTCTHMQRVIHKLHGDNAVRAFFAPSSPRGITEIPRQTSTAARPK